MCRVRECTKQYSAGLGRGASQGQGIVSRIHFISNLVRSQQRRQPVIVKDSALKMRSVPLIFVSYPLMFLAEEFKHKLAKVVQAAVPTNNHRVAFLGYSAAVE